MLEIGSIFDGKYEVMREVGRGGMSIVYLAYNARINRNCAIKEAKKSGDPSGGVMGLSLQAEVEMLKTLSHDNIVRITDVVETEESLYIVMDYIEGLNLLEVLEQNGPLSKERVIPWAIQLCDAMNYLHSQRPPIIYRDLKPANVILRPDNRVIVIDFGTARTQKGGKTRDTTCLGTPDYAAPEQFNQTGETDARTDIYNLGATMSHLLTGISQAQTDFDVRPLGELRPEYEGSGIEYIISKCCQRSRDNRYQSMEELRRDLEREEELGANAVRQDKKRFRLFLAPVVALLIGIAGMIGFRTVQNATIQNTYDVALSRAERASNIQAGKEDFIAALKLKPSDPEGYTALLNYITDDDTINENERNILLEILNARPDDVSDVNCFEIFRRDNEEQYARFRFELGEDYFFFYGNSLGQGRYEYAKKELEPFKKNGAYVGYLKGTEPQRAETFYLISDVMNLEQKDIGLVTQWDTGKDGYYEIYLSLNNLLGDKKEAEAKCGTIGNTFAVCKVLGDLAQKYHTEFRSDGVSKAEMLTLLQEAKEYIESTPGGMKDQSIRNSAKSAITSAHDDLSEKY